MKPQKKLRLIRVKFEKLEHAIRPNGNSLVNIRGTYRDFLAYSASEAYHVDQDASDIRSIRPPIESIRIVVHPRGFCTVQILDVQISFPNDVIIGHHHTGNG